MKKPIPVIDIFAGPGGLGEGFSSIKIKNEPIFKIKLSIEKDKYARSTLLLRAFYRQFIGEKTPPEYYQYLKGEISREDLFRAYPMQASNAEDEAWLAELGVTNNNEIDERITKAIANSNNWILIGGPPCQAYSLAGRSRIRGADKDKYKNDPRHFLYKEYLRILAVHQPTIFVMENVKGLLSSKINDDLTFDLIKNDLKKPENCRNKKTGEQLKYHLFSLTHKNHSNETDLRSEDFIVRSEDYGIPQARHRLFILGIRSDVYKTDPELLTKVEKVSVQEVLNDLPKLRSTLSKAADSPKEWHKAVYSIINERWLEDVDEKVKIGILKDLERVKKNLSKGGPFIKKDKNLRKLSKWFNDSNLDGVCNHESRGHIQQDLHRYFFVSEYAKIMGKSPTLKDFPTDLLPEHKNVKEAVNGEKFGDRFRVQVASKPSTTVVSHISKDGHYYIHYDPTQCRSLTVREAARLQTFPDNYFFEGNRTEQYHQVGNAVPPLLANKIASIVATLIKKMELDE